MSEIETLIERLRSSFPALPSREILGWRGNPALNVLDCVLSLRRRYDAFVLPRVKRFAAEHPTLNTLQALRDLIESYPTPFDFSAVELRYKDADRANTLRATLSYLLDVQQEFDCPTECDRLRAWAESARPGDFAFTGVRGLGLAGFQYLRLLLGANTAKPDVWICRFVSNSIDRTVGPVAALFLLERAARRANFSLRDIDAAIWKQRASVERPKRAGTQVADKPRQRETAKGHVTRRLRGDRTQNH